MVKEVTATCQTAINTDAFQAGCEINALNLVDTTTLVTFKVTSGDLSITSTYEVTVNRVGLPSIVTQPTDTWILPMGPVSFSVLGSVVGDYPLSYQWEAKYIEDNGFTEVAGKSTKTIAFDSVPMKYNNTQVRCKYVLEKNVLLFLALVYLVITTT